MDRQIYQFASTRRVWPMLPLLLAVVCLSVLGLIMLFSATYSHYPDPYFIVRKQAMWFALALIACAGASCVNLEKLRLFVAPMTVGVFVLLSLVFIPGVGMKINGARRWLDLGPMNMQVSDFAKIAFVFVLAHYLAVNQRHLETFRRGFLIPCLLIGTTVVMIMLQPDFGTGFLIGLVGFTMLFLAGARFFQYLLPSVLLSCMLFSVAVAFDPIRLRRITSFLDVEANKADGAYQLWQGILAFGSGGLYGVGLGNGRQQMAYLPEAHTDFIFPIIGEELGFFFTSGVVMVFLALFGFVMYRLRRSPNLFQFLLVSGALLLITFQALINFGVVTGCLPTKGISLPFISYGGSNLVSMFILIGLIINCFRLWNRSPLRTPLEI